MVAELGLKVEGKNSAAELLDRFDNGKKGALSYTSFITQVLGLRADALAAEEGAERRPSSPETLQAVSAGVKKHLQMCKGTVEKAFEMFDRDRSNYITPKEFYEGCRAAGLPVSEKQANSLFKSLDADGEGSLSMQELGAAVLGAPRTPQGLPPAFAAQRMPSRSISPVKISAQTSQRHSPSSHSHSPSKRASPTHRTQRSGRQTAFEKYGTADSPAPAGKYGNDLQVQLGVGGATFPPLGSPPQASPTMAPTTRISRSRSSMSVRSGREDLAAYYPDWKSHSVASPPKSSRQLYDINIAGPRSVLFKGTEADGNHQHCIEGR